MISHVPNPRAVIGANNPPDTDPLLIEANERIDNANRWLTERGNLDLWDAAIADKASFFLSQVDGTAKALDAQRLEENRAHTARQKAKYEGPLTLLGKAKDALTHLRRGWLQREEDRLRKEREAKAAEAKRLADEAAKVIERAQAEAAKKGGDPLRAELQAEEAKRRAQKAADAAAAAPEKAQIKGSFTTTAKSLRDKWSAEIVDLSAAFKHYNKKGHPAKAALEEAIRECIQDIADREARLRKSEDPASFPAGIKFIKERV